jgi:phage terminase large subunit-like protein
MARKRTLGKTPGTKGRTSRADYEFWPRVPIEVSPGVTEEFTDFCGIALDHAKRLVDGLEPACRWVKLAAERYLEMRRIAGTAAASFHWSPAHVVDVCSFLEKLPHVEGSQWTRSGPVRLEPWQCFVVSAIYGFRRNGSGVRLVRDVLVVIPRKSGKSLLTAGLGHYALTCEGEDGPSIYIGARTVDQARKVFDPMVKMIKKEPLLAEAFGLKDLTKKIRCSATLGEVQLITQVAETQDGHNPHMVILEELHAQEEGLFHVMSSSQAARENPLLFKITTAGRVAAGICWDQIKAAERVLEGLHRQDDLFAIIYTVDKDDDLWVEKTWIKANPMWGVSVSPEKVREDVSKALNNPSAQAEFLRTRLNVWSNAGARLVEPGSWAACVDPKLDIDAFRGRKVWIGVDLASRRDMAATVVIVEDGEDICVFPRFYIPSDCPALLDPDLTGMYQAWMKAGHVIETGPGMIDFDVIEADIREDAKFFDVEVVAFDPYQAQQLAQNLAKTGINVVLFANSARNMTEPTDDFVARVSTETLRHDGNPVLEWHAMNVVAYRDQKGNVLPKKDAPNSKHKIDGIHALVFANGCRLQGKKPDKKKERLHVYTQRGVHGASEPQQRG